MLLSLVKVGQSEAPLALAGSSDQFMYEGARDDTRPFDAAEGKVGPRGRFPPSETDSPNMAVTEQRRMGGKERGDWNSFPKSSARSRRQFLVHFQPS